MHRLTESGVYVVTAGTYGKSHHFAGEARLGVLCRGLLSVCHDSGWLLEAWAVFSNHYHFVACAPTEGAQSLSTVLGRLHSRTASWVNKLDGIPERQVWHNFWESQLTYEKSYLARLQYVHENPVKHGLVKDARLYPYCSAAWLEQTATPAQINTVRSFGTTRVKMIDDFEVSANW